jgi:hypothetical protein
MEPDADVLDAQRRRAAKNQSLFREVNERIEKLADGSSSAAFVCECLQEECGERLTLTLDAYETVRASPNRFFVVPGHAFADIEEVTTTTDTYLIVQKLGAGGELAVTLDPRARKSARVNGA